MLGVALVYVTVNDRYPPELLRKSQPAFASLDQLFDPVTGYPIESPVIALV